MKMFVHTLKKKKETRKGVMPLEHTSFIEGPNQMSTNMGTELKKKYAYK